MLFWVKPSDTNDESDWDSPVCPCTVAETRLAISPFFDLRLCRSLTEKMSKVFWVSDFNDSTSAGAIVTCYSSELPVPTTVEPNVWDFRGQILCQTLLCFCEVSSAGSHCASHLTLIENNLMAFNCTLRNIKCWSVICHRNHPQYRITQDQIQVFITKQALQKVNKQYLICFWATEKQNIIMYEYLLYAVNLLSSHKCL